MRLHNIIILTILLIFNYSSYALISIGYRYSTIGNGIEGKIMLQDGIYLRGAYIHSTNNTTIQNFSNIITTARKTLSQNNVLNTTVDELLDKGNTYLAAIPNIVATSIPIMLDYHFFSRSGFKLSPGLVIFLNDSKINIISTNNKPLSQILPAVTIGYDAALVGTDFINFSIEYGWLFFVDPSIDWSKTIPILSLGMKLSI